MTGREHIPKNVPVIFAANHENAFIDAFLVATHNDRLCNFLVRADVFRFKLARMFFSTLNMMPVYRIRDGFNSLKSNESIFESCYESLGNGESLIMFPEGSHDKRRIPRRLTKGISRLAIGTMNSNHAPEELYIIPVGLDYSAHDAFRSSVQINFGTPILVEKEPMENAFYDAIRNNIEKGLKATHIGLEESNYQLLDNLCFGVEQEIPLADHKVINQQGERLNQCIQNDPEVNNLLKHSDIFSRMVATYGCKVPNKKTGLLTPLLSILLLPVFFYGAVANGLVLLLVYFVDQIIIKDKVFIGSVNFSIGFFLLPVLWSWQHGLFTSEYGSGIHSFIFLCSMPLSLICFQIIKDSYTQTIGTFRLALNKNVAQEFETSFKYLKAYKTRCLGG